MACEGARREKALETLPLDAKAHRSVWTVVDGVVNDADVCGVCGTCANPAFAKILAVHAVLQGYDRLWLERW